MEKIRGFSLTEVLVSLFLVISISLALLKQQWQISRVLQHILNQLDQITALENSAEKNHQRGFSLIEIFVTLLLISGLVGELIQHYIQIKKHYSSVQTVIDEAMEVQLVSDLIRMSVRKAGFTPCRAIHQLDTIHLVSLVTTEDTIHSYRMGDNYGLVAIKSANTLEVSPSLILQPTHPILIADCYHAEVQYIDNLYSTASGQLLQLSHPLNFKYQPPVYIGAWIEESYGIKHHREHAALTHTLYHTEELSTHIRKMTVYRDNHLSHSLLKIIMKLDRDQIHTFYARSRMA